ncbi:MAG: nucleotidyltransferase domain-containing protein [Bacillota bacterium]|nr:nucleotidyltransferase domain-containing protein [Bacillota bacterium]
MQLSLPTVSIEHLRRALEEEVAELLAQPTTIGLAIFGSVARGDYRAGSDIELLVITHSTTGHEVSSSRRHGVCIHKHLQRSVDLEARRQIDWRIRPPFADGWIVIDGDGQLVKLKELDTQLAKAGRRNLAPEEVDRLGHSLRDRLQELEGLEKDPVALGLLYHALIREAIRAFYALAGRWEPGPKRLSADLRQHSPQFLALIKQALLQSSDLERARQLVNLVLVLLR